MVPSFRYTVSFLEPGSHVYHLRLEITDLPAGKHAVTLPVWTPGAYTVQDFARHLFKLEVASGEQSLDVFHLTKNRWEFDTVQTETVVVTYDVYAFELGVDTSHLDQSHAYWNGAQLFFQVDHYVDQPIDVAIEHPPGWHASTGLDRSPNAPGLYRAKNYDILIDSPVEVGTHPVLTFTVDDKPHFVAIWGHGNEDPDRLTADIEKIVKTQRDLFGSLPYDHYTFILHLPDRGTGGLEHLNSTTCGIERFMFKPWKNYRKVLSLIAHEFFHLWNVKRIHPEMLGPFDYTKEVYTRLLWAMEGFTDYYSSLSLRRSKLYTVKDYLSGMADRIKLYETLPGRFVQSLSESSFDTWIKLYKPDEDSRNRTISYYLKGDLVGTCLDLEIRHRTQNRRSLDDVLKRLYERYGSQGVGFPESVYQETIEEVGESSFQDFFDRYVDGTEPVPLDDYLLYAGLHILREYKNPEQDSNDEGDEDKPQASPLPWLGVDTKEKGQHKLTVSVSYTNGPAYALLNPGDQIIAINGFQVDSPNGLKKRLHRDHRPGDTIEVAYFRRGQLETVRLVLGTAPFNKVQIKPVADPTAEQKALYESWLQESWPDGPSV